MKLFKFNLSPKFVFLCCFPFVGCLLQAQSATHFPWRWEIGVRSVNMAPYYQATNSQYHLMGNEQVSLGAEVFLLDRRPNHTFSRLAIGIGAIRRNHHPFIDEYVNQQIVIGNTSRASALAFEAAYGIELPQITRPTLSRLRLRAGLNLAMLALQTQVSRISVINFQGHRAFEHHFATGGTMFRGTVFFQSEFMFAPNCFLGLELHFGPNLFLNNHQNRNQLLIVNEAGHQFERDDSQNRGARFQWDNPLGFPALNIGFSF